MLQKDEYYMENGMFVLTEVFLRRRGYCCNRGCRHCPYISNANKIKSEMEHDSKPCPNEKNKSSSNNQRNG